MGIGSKGQLAAPAAPTLENNKMYRKDKKGLAWLRQLEGKTCKTLRFFKAIENGDIVREGIVKDSYLDQVTRDDKAIFQEEMCRTVRTVKKKARKSQKIMDDLCHVYAANFIFLEKP